VESDKPVAFQGKAYQWTQILDVHAGRETTLELTAGNAEVEAVAGETSTGSGFTIEADPSSLLTHWQDSVVAIWTPTARASGFVIGANGLIATSQRVVGTAASVEVQLTPRIKVTGTVLAADAVRDAAVLWIDPKVVASARVVPLGCGQPPLAVERGQELVAIGAPLRQHKGAFSGTVSRVDANVIASDVALAAGSAGGPVFSTGGATVGVTSVEDENAGSGRGNVRVVRAGAVCDVLASAEKKTKDASIPDGTLLPVEPERPFAIDTLQNAAKGRAGSLNPYQVSSNDFDIAFITPVLTYGAQYQAEQMGRRERGKGAGPDPQFIRQSMDFANWSDYVMDFPPVLLVRVSPKFEESFWTKVARGAASTQGMALPPIKRFKPGFLRMRAFCGDKEVTPIHPFKLERWVSETDAIYEGLYVFDPGALGPQCGTVKLSLYSEKLPDKADTQVVDPKVIQQVWQDFEPYRAGK
jgi:hypothetical protein